MEYVYLVLTDELYDKSNTTMEGEKATKDVISDEEEDTVKEVLHTSRYKSDTEQTLKISI